jgi:hypothetical protein
MDLVFDIDKTIAAVGYLLLKQGGKSTIFVLLKKLYAAERHALLEWHRPITGDTFVSLPKGPVLSRTYDLIKREISAENSDMKRWAVHFSERKGNNLVLLLPPNFDFLSDRERGALDSAHEEIESLISQYGQIANVLHQKWPEWKDPAEFGRSSIPLTLEEILMEGEDDEDEVRRVSSEIRSVQRAKAALQVSPL